jgi:hypothetical protein
MVNWHQYQHYKDRSPTWIKSYTRLIDGDSIEFSRLSDAQKWQMHAITMLASRHNNSIPCDPAWISERLHLSSKLDLKALEATGMLEIVDVASNVLAECKQDATLEKSREEESAPASAASKRTPFAPPSVDEVAAYISESGYTVSAEKFVSFYESKGWMVGKARMVSWRAAVTGWQKTDDERKAPKQRPLLSAEENAQRAKQAREMV